MSLLLLLRSSNVPPPGVVSVDYSPSIPQIGQAVRFTDVTTPTQTSWLWNFGAGATPSTSTQSSVSVVFNTLGTRSVTLRPQPVNSTWTQSLTVVPVPVRFINVSIGFQSTGNNANPTFTDVSQYIRSIEVSRGRQHELDRVEAGVAHIRLDNRTRAFDPTNAASPFYFGGTGLLPMKRIQVTVNRNGLSYPIFYGFIEAWPRTRQGVTESEVEISCTDAFAVFAAADVAVHNFPQQRTGERISEALTFSDWGATKQIIDTPARGGAGYTVPLVTKTAPTEESLLEFIQTYADTEIGRFFMDSRGNAVFHDANHRVRVANGRTTRGLSSVLGKFADAEGIQADPAALPYEDVVSSYDVSEVRNWIDVTDHDGAHHTTSDSTSISNYLTRVYQRSTDLFFDIDATDQAAWLLQRYRAPSLRYSSMVLNPYTDARLWDYVLGAPFGATNPDDYIELGAQITVIENPPGGGSPILRNCYIEAISHDIESNTKWKTTWQLSPATTAGVSVASPWVIGTSKIGVDTIIG